MIAAITGPLVVQPQCWQVVFSRELSSRRWVNWLAWGEFKHVSAYAYVPFLHVWVFFDPHFRGTDIIVAAEGDPALAMISSRIRDAAVISVRRRPNPVVTQGSLPLLGYCVPTVRRLVGVPGRTLSVSGFYLDCLACGGIPLVEANDGRPKI